MPASHSRNRRWLLGVVLCLAVVALSSCKSKNPIVGKWQDEYGDTWEFFEDGTVTLDTQEMGVISGDYRFTDDTHIRLDFAGLWGIAGPMVFEVHISGNTLSIKDSSGGAMEMKRAK